jgi:hypothetical protein
MFNINLLLVSVALIAACSCDAFVAVAPARSSVVMSASPVSKAAAAAAAALVCAGAVGAPVQAAFLQAPDASHILLSAEAKGEKQSGTDAKYKPKQVGKFAKEQSTNGVDFGSPKGTHIGTVQCQHQCRSLSDFTRIMFLNMSPFLT